jgi:tRNA A-37 threonylcarbamoyl transferase component Bud32
VTSSSTTKHLAQGSLVGPWTVDAVLGEGTTATVYAAHSGNTTAAVKVLHSALVTDDMVRERFRREAALLRTVNHPSLVRVLGTSDADGKQPWIAFAQIEGESLSNQIERTGARSVVDTWNLVRPIAEALSELHNHGVVHRDVKPENIRMAHGVPVLVDLGSARWEAKTTDHSHTTTLQGSVVGTPAYMPPEQWWGDGVCAASDQYALGVTAFEVLTGRRPFRHQPINELMHAHLNENVPSVNDLLMDGWLQRCMAKSPDHRFASMGDAIEAGNSAWGGAAIKPKTHYALAGVLVVFLLMTAVGYQGDHSPLEWIHIAGFAAILSVICGIVGMVVLAYFPSRNDILRVVILLALFSGATGTWSGFAAIERGLPRAPPAQQFEIFQLGVSEANANRFLSAGIALALTLGSALLTKAKKLNPFERSVFWGSCVMAVLSWILGQPSAVLPCMALALATSRLRVAVLREHVLGAFAMVLYGTVTALTRVESRQAVAWSLQPDRASRVVELIQTQSEYIATVTLSLVALTAVCALTWRARSTKPGAPWSQHKAQIALGLWVALEAGHELRVKYRREAMYAALAPQFELFTQLDPPPSNDVAKALPSRAPSLRISAGVIAVDDFFVGIHSALQHEIGRNTLGQDLSHRLARDGGSTHGVQLSLLVDRHVSASVMARALEVAWGVGVRRVEILFTHGKRVPVLSPSAPAEAAWVLPRDFTSVALQLGATGLKLDETRSFGDQSEAVRHATSISVTGATDTP